MERTFLPSVGEVTTGFRWLQRHPVVMSATSAAATVYSVVSYLRQEEDARDSEQLHKVISWSDDHGGSLTQIFGEDDDCDEYEKETRPNKSSLKRGRSQENLSEQEGLTKNEVGIREGGAISPQWGWYVAITPPQHEQYAAAPREGCT